MNNPYIQDGYLDVAALLGIDRNELRYATYSRADFDEEIFYLSQDFATAQMLDKLNLNTLYSYTENLFFI